MNCHVRRWRIVLRVALALALIVAAMPLPCLAQQPGQTAPKPGLKASIQPAVHAVVVATPAAKPVRAQATGDVKAPLESKSFFKTTTGVIVLAVVGAGLGFTFYSMSHDRIPVNSNR